MNCHTRHVVTSALVIAGLVLLLHVPTSFAQSGELRADIPFDFYVSGKLLPAGTYVVKPMNATAVRIWDGNRSSAVVSTYAAANSDLKKPRLVFQRYGTVNFLSELYWEGYSAGRALHKTARELEASNGHARSTIQVATTKK